MSQSDPDSQHPHQVELSTFIDDRGKLSVVESSERIPFDIERVYYLYDVPPDATRGNHAHKRLQQIMIAVSGSLDVLVETSAGSEQFHLDSPGEGLYIPRMTWRELSNFTSGTVCIVLASQKYDESDYIHEYESFQKQLES
jgi:dTDP-4-dehydrorhamnose 3,5-epimerase-like enzyme